MGASTDKLHTERQDREQRERQPGADESEELTA
jgi:hypothetical protein